MICKILERQAARCRRFPCSCPSRKSNPGWLSLGTSCRLEKQWDVWVFSLWTDREWAAIWPKSHHSPKSLLLYSLTGINSHNSSGGLVSPVKMATFPHNTCMNNSALSSIRGCQKCQPVGSTLSCPERMLSLHPVVGLGGCTLTNHTYRWPNAIAFSVPGFHCLQDTEVLKAQDTCSEQTVVVLRFFWDMMLVDVTVFP